MRMKEHVCIRYMVDSCTYIRLIISVVEVLYRTGISHYRRTYLFYITITLSYIFYVIFCYSLFVIVVYFNILIPELQLLECVGTSCKGTAFGSPCTSETSTTTHVHGFLQALQTEWENISQDVIPTPIASM